MAYFFQFSFLFINFLFYASDAQFTLPAENSKVLTKWSGYCPSGTICRPLSSCPTLQMIINSNCTDIDKVIGCGDKPGLFCCPVEYEANNGITVDGVSCGLSTVQAIEDYEGVGAYPFVARIGFKNKWRIQFHCGGSILNDQYILTSAKCALTEDKNLTVFMVRVGEYATNTKNDCNDDFCGLAVQDILIEEFTVHPRYRWNSQHNDIGLIKLYSKINFTATVRPICLPDPKFTQMRYNEGILVGWEHKTGLVEKYEQQALRVPIINSDMCREVFPNITDEEFCAGNLQSNRKYGGFEGGPLMVKEGLNYYQIGILSFANDQAESSGVSLYTNLIKHVTTITDMISTKRATDSGIDDHTESSIVSLYSNLTKYVKNLKEFIISTKRGIGIN